jgi:hypothetical protein
MKFPWPLSQPVEPGGRSAAKLANGALTWGADVTFAGSRSETVNSCAPYSAVMDGADTQGDGLSLGDLQRVVVRSHATPPERQDHRQHSLKLQLTMVATAAAMVIMAVMPIIIDRRASVFDLQSAAGGIESPVT